MRTHFIFAVRHSGNLCTYLLVFIGHHEGCLYIYCKYQGSVYSLLSPSNGDKIVEKQLKMFFSLKKSVNKEVEIVNKNLNVWIRFTQGWPPFFKFLVSPKNFVPFGQINFANGLAGKKIFRGRSTNLKIDKSPFFAFPQLSPLFYLIYRIFTYPLFIVCNYY